jgi:tRNA pseudouridine38-40 synthase
MNVCGMRTVFHCIALGAAVLPKGRARSLLRGHRFKMPRLTRTRAISHVPCVLLRIAYEGTNFSGWAPQATQRTVAGCLNEAIQRVIRTDTFTALRAASRTDAGVHARDQVAAFDTSRLMSPQGWLHVLNQNLPDDMAVRSVASAEEGYDPRFRSTGKRYAYRILSEKVRDPFGRAYSWRIDSALDIERMRAEASAFVGTHEFGAFHSARDHREGVTRTIDRIEIHQEGEAVIIRVYGKAFLYNMVRIMVGTLVDIGRDRKEPGTVLQALRSQVRSDAGMTAPAHGLTLEEIQLDCLESDRWPA